MNDLECQAAVLEEFYALCAIPRPSGHEERVSAWLMERLERLGLCPERDSALNVRCDVPATPGLERQGRLILQAHSDMVCVGAPDYRPLEDPVRTELREGFLCSDGRSSLGADCGIGLAAALALAASEAPHGPLRLIFTADEERGLAGAKKLSPDWVQNCDGLINLDGFHFGRLLISSAGGLRQRFSKVPELFFPMLDCPVKLALSGLTGGHSGDDIGLGRANAAKLLVWLLQALELPYELASIHVGDTYNAIPAVGEAVIVIDSRDQEKLRAWAAEFLNSAKAIYGEADPDISLTITPAEMPQWVLTVDQREDLLALAGLIQCGPWEDHPLCPGCVGFSGSMGRLWADGDKLEIYSFLRSCDDEKMDQYGDFYETAAQGFGFTAWRDRYSAWPGVERDPLTDCFLAAGRDLNIPLEKGAVHVGLEASVFHAMAPEMPVVSVGMEVLDPHSVSERVRLDPVGPFLHLLEEVTKQYAGA